MKDTAQLDRELNAALLAEDVVMQENGSPPSVGKPANRKRQEYYGAVAECIGVKLLGSAVAGDRSFSEWEFDIKFQGLRYTVAAVAVRQWRDGTIVHERFDWNQQTAPL